ncbi:hypothetical protein FJY71_04345 [candidate division WOR-3 bacterium]|nr:hypothetical protein [candidate division WOR-3 bacterium]
MPRNYRKLAWCLTAALLAPLLLLGDPLRLKRVAELAYGTLSGHVLCGDADHDGANEMIFGRARPRCWEVWEVKFPNRYSVVLADTGGYPYPPGIDIGNFKPWDIGDIDGDSLTDLLGHHVFFEDSISYRFVLGVQESPDLHSYPSELSWWADMYPSTTPDQPASHFPPDLDNDGRREACGIEEFSSCHYVFENSGNNQNTLVWTDTLAIGYGLAFGDFDLDGRRDFVTAGITSAGPVNLYECAGDNSYAVTWRDSVRIPNGHDVFSGNDVDRDGKPEFFIAFSWYGPPAEFHLMAFEMVADNEYERREVACVTRDVGVNWEAYSKCADVDADSVEEIVWTIASDVYVYKATGNDQYELVWQWQNPSQCVIETVHVSAYDLNGNGYNEVVASGILGGAGGHPEWGTCIFELETVQLLSPNGGRNLLGGVTCAVRWQVFTPPRCDSVSLFLRTDTTWNMDTIATGLAPADTPYLWVVPRGPRIVEPCHVVVFAYGPGWQYDESDSAFKIITLGAAEAAPRAPGNWSLSVSPSPARGIALVRFDVPHHANVRVGLYDAAGRLAEQLASGVRDAGSYGLAVGAAGNVRAGVHFVRLETAERTLSRKLVVTERR